jgi:hypothetical protein
VSQPINPQQVRKRMLLFYFAAGANLLMGFYVMAAGGAIAERSTVWLIACVFLAFAGVNYYMARTLVRRWHAHAQEQKQNEAGAGLGDMPK